MPSVQEKDRRFAALRTLMRAQGYQALVLSGNAEATQRGYIRYVADWRLWGGKGFVVLPLEGEPLLILGGGSQSYWSKRVSWVPAVRAAGDLVAEVVRAIEELGLAEATLGLVGMRAVICYGDLQRLQQGLGRVQWVDATPEVDRIMAVKSSEELALAAEGYRAVAQAHATLRQVLAPGKSERAVMAQATAVLAERGCLDGIAHLTSEASPFFRPPTERMIEPGDILKVSLEFAGPSGYWVELSGVYSFRPPPDRERRYYASSLKAIERVKAILRPGATGGDVTRVIEETFAQDGWKVTGRGVWDGHLIGLNVIAPPYGQAGNRDLFQENMLFNIHPGLLVDDDQFGLFVQDNLVVTPAGGRPLDSYRHEWCVLPSGSCVHSG